MHLTRIRSLVLPSIYAERLRNRRREHETLCRRLNTCDQLIAAIWYEWPVLIRQIRDCDL